MVQRGPFDPDDFFHFAEALFRDVGYTDEATTRTILGRLYYSLFLKCKDALEKGGWEGYNGRIIHKELYDELRERGLYNIRSKLKQMHDDYRVPADYNLKSIPRSILENAFLLHTVIKQEMNRDL